MPDRSSSPKNLGQFKSLGIDIEQYQQLAHTIADLVGPTLKAVERIGKSPELLKFGEQMSALHSRLASSEFQQSLQQMTERVDRTLVLSDSALSKVALDLQAMNDRFAEMSDLLAPIFSVLNPPEIAPGLITSPSVVYAPTFTAGTLSADATAGWDASAAVDYIRSLSTPDLRRIGVYLWRAVSMYLTVASAFWAVEAMESQKRDAEQATLEREEINQKIGNAIMSDSVQNEILLEMRDSIAVFSQIQTALAEELRQRDRSGTD